jgi:hypothetical protein
LSKYTEANEKLKRKIRTMRANKAFDSEEGREQIRLRAEQLRAEIAEVQADTAEIQRRLDEAAEKRRGETREVGPPDRVRP